MPRRARGVCKVCGKELSRAPLLKHVHTHTSSASGEGERSDARHLFLIEGSYGKACFKLIAAKPSVSGRELHDYAEEWIDCGCGHLSSSDFQSVARVSDMQTGRKYSLDFDMGSPTQLLITGLGPFNTPNVDNNKSIVVLAAATRTDAKCIKCGEPATQYCSGCAQGAIIAGGDGEDDGLFCDECHDDDADDDAEVGGDMEHDLQPIDAVQDLLTSPRFGSCGYY